MCMSIRQSPVLKAAESPVICIEPTMKLESVAKLFKDRQIHAAPVVDGFGKCIGILSSGDLVRYEAIRSSMEQQFQHGVAFDMAHYSDGTPMELLGQPFDEVAYHMTREVLTVGRDATLDEAARVMCDAQVHHVILLDEVGRPEGIVSPLDVLGVLIGSTCRTKAPLASSTASHLPTVNT